MTHRTGRWFVAMATLFTLLTGPGVVVSRADDPISERIDESIPPEESSESEGCPTEGPKRVIGATADFIEKSSGFHYTGRVDTGATTCSIHVTKVKVEDSNKSMLKNIGKKISFLLESPEGKKKRVSTTIADTVRVKTSEEKERRYKVWLTLQHGGIERRVHVTLNDRSHMEYPLLIGRNFLCGRFVVDVEQDHTPFEVAASDEAASDDGEEG